jgi:plasmid segregation protein ParM
LKEGNKVMNEHNKKLVEVKNMLVVDLGFSSAKYLSDGRRGMVKSCYRKMKGADSYKFNGDDYLVGERALIETGSHYLRTLDELIAFYPLFVGVAAKKAEATNRDTLVVGLPFDFWKEEMSKEKRGAPNAISKLKDSLKVFRINDEEFGFEKVLIFPQGLGGTKDYLSENGTVAGNILAIDIGFNTVISTLYCCEEKEILAGKTYYKRGVYETANILMPEIAGHIGGKTLSPLEVNHLIETGRLQVGFDLVDIRPEINAAISTYVKDLLNMIVGDLKAHSGVISFDTVLLFGGGARLLQDKIEAKKVNVVALREPEFANARGFAKKALEINGK